ncbi:MAG: serine protein kinase RIO [Methanoculleaceae archaeon]
MPVPDELEFDRKIERLGLRIRDMDQLKVRQEVFDEVTLLALYRLANRGLITAIGGSVSTGKEGNIFYGEGEGGPIAIKIYRIRTANFRAMTDYLIGDRRFSNIRPRRKDIIFAWTRKEYSNLCRAMEAGIPVPGPRAFDRNILLMDFLGEDERPYPQLRLVEPEDPAATYKEIIGYIGRLYSRAHLVHADLSEYNILMGDRVYIIDMGQAVTGDHPRAREFLLRDIGNINRFFSRLCDVEDERAIFERVLGSAGRKE